MRAICLVLTDYAKNEIVAPGLEKFVQLCDDGVRINVTKKSTQYTSKRASRHENEGNRTVLCPADPLKLAGVGTKPYWPLGTYGALASGLFDRRAENWSEGENMDISSEAGLPGGFEGTACYL